MTREPPEKTPNLELPDAALVHTTKELGFKHSTWEFAAI
jgi:hypothetical protein